MFVFAQNGFEIMFDDHLVRKEALPDYINIDFIEFLYWIISKEIPMILVKKLEFSSVSVLDKMGLEIMFDGHPRRKRAILDYKISIYKVATLDFLKEVNPRFWSKIVNEFFVCDI